MAVVTEQVATNERALGRYKKNVSLWKEAMKTVAVFN